MRVVGTAGVLVACFASAAALSQASWAQGVEGIAGPVGLRGVMPMSGAILDVPSLEPGALYDQEMLLVCIGPDVLMGLDQRSRALAAAFVYQSANPAIVVDGAARRFEVLNAVNSEGGWGLVFHHTAKSSANPPHWTDGIATAQSLVLELPDGAVDLLALTTPEDRAAFSAGCAAERVGRGVGAPPLPEGAEPAVVYEPTRYFRFDQVWRPTLAVPGTVTWSVEGDGVDAALVGTITIPGVADATLSIARGADERTLRFSYAIEAAFNIETGWLTDGFTGDELVKLLPVVGAPGQFRGRQELDLVDLVAMFDGPLIYVDGVDSSRPMIAFAAGPSGRARLAEARRAWAGVP